MAEVVAMLNDLRAVVGGVPVILFALDRDGVFTLSEGGGLIALGRTPGAIVGRSIFDVYHDQPAILDGVGRALADASTTAAVEVNGTIYQAQYAPLRDAAGAVIGVLGLGVDITAQQRTAEALRQSDTRYRTLVAALSDGVVMQATDGRIIASNASAERILGLTADQLAERTSLDPRWRAVHEDGAPFLGAEHPAMIALATGEPQVGVTMGIHKPDGTLVWLVVTAQPLIAAGETCPHAVVVSFTDVTAQRRDAATLARSEARFRALTEHASDLVAVTDAVGTILYRSASITRLLGYPTDVPPRGTVFAMVHPDDRARVRDYLAACLEAAHAVPPIELRLRHRDGSWRPFETVASNLLADPAVGGLVFTSRDIGARQAAEAALRESEARYRVILGALHEGVVLQDAAGRIVAANPAAERLIGLTADQLRGATSLDPRWRAVHEDGTPCPGENHPASIALRTGVRQREIVMGIHKPDGTLIWLLVTAEPLRDPGSDRPSGVVASFVDITARKGAEDALRASEARFRALVDHSGDAVLLTAPDGRILAANPAATRMFGYAEEDIRRLGRAGLVDTADPRLPALLASRERTGVARGELTHRRADGTTFPAEIVSVVFQDRDGATLTSMTIRDISARHAAEAALRESEARLKDFLDNASDLIHSHDERGRFAYVNRAWCEALGYSQEELADMTILNIIAPEEHDFCRTMQERLDAGAELGVVETVFVARDGRRITVEGGVNCRIAPDGTRLTRGIFRDVTARRALEVRLAHQATHDALTGLPNRALFLERLSAALARTNRDGAAVAVLFLDLDGFKAVNDGLGHAAGDLLLAVTARRLLDCIRVGDTAARLGGDEFAVVLEPLADIEGAEVVARRVIAALALPVFVGMGEACVSASIGIAVSAVGDTADMLLSAADTAMYRAKRSGTSLYVVHDSPTTRQQAIAIHAD